MRSMLHAPLILHIIIIYVCLVVHVQTTKALKALLRDKGIDYEARRFETEDGVAGLGPMPFAAVRHCTYVHCFSTFHA